MPTSTLPLLRALCAIISLYVTAVFGLGATDTITWGGDVSRSGYETNHNMDPAIVGSPSFGQIFKTQLPGNFNGIGPEQIYSQPLVYTGSDGVQYVYVATTQNNVYKIDAKTGTIIAKRNLWVPFLQAELGNCVDINPTIGVTATGVIDPSTGIWYLTAKTYTDKFQDGNFSPSNRPGRLNGRYYFHGINTADLTDAFKPQGLEFLSFRNNPNRLFLAGNQHQRPALLQVGDFIYTGWASHCIAQNYTGAIIGFNKNTGAVVEAFSTEGGPEPNTVPGGGVWMSGGGLSYSAGSIFFATGNGYASQLPATGQSVPGRNPPTALEEAAVNAKINDDGTISIIDFFMPWEKTQLDGADKDLGTSPLELLPPSTFSCPNHKRIGIVTGKSGKTYWLNLDSLGGYQMASDKRDDVIQVFQNENIVYSGAGVMPLNGGYIYINVIQYPTHVFKFGCNAQGNAVFTKVSDTTERNAYTLGVGHGTTTSLNGQEGTGLLWITDIDGLDMRIYNAIPPAQGNLTLVNSFNIPGITKFSRPMFGNGRAYVGTKGFLYGFGSPVSLPLNCSSPYTFPNTAIGNTSDPMTVTCISNVQTTINGITLTGNPNFKISNVPSTPFSIPTGGTFNFTANFVPKTVGLLSSDVVVNTTNGGAGYTASTPITLKGTANSVKPLLAVRPNTVSFSTIVGQGADDQTFIVANNGDSLLTISNIAYSQKAENGPTVQPNTTSDGYTQVGPFVLKGVPTSIPGGGTAPVTVSYTPIVAGNDALFLNLSSDGGSSLLDIVGVAGTQPVALFEFQTPDGQGWVPYVAGQNFTFGNVTENTTRNLKFRVTNNGSSTAAPLAITVSKPPYGLPAILGTVNQIDLGEGTSLAAGESKAANMFCSPPKSQVNLPSYSQTVQWTMNTGDINSGKKFFQFSCNAVTEQLGPLFPNGTARYPYVGCGVDYTGNRQLPTLIYTDAANNTNDECINACFAKGWKFAATEYLKECWCGNAIPTQFNDESYCTYQCSGDSRQTCGGAGANGPAMSLFADSLKWDGNKTSPPLAMVQSYQNYNYIGCYSEPNGKPMSIKNTSSTSMTVEYCGSQCSSGAYPYFALEYGQECWCSKTILNNPVQVSDGNCSFTCAGNNSEYCGASQRAQIYALNGTAVPPLSSSASTVTGTSAPSSIAPTDPGASPTTTTTTATTLASAPSAPATIGAWTLLGCYIDNGSRPLQKKSKTDSTISNNACANFCQGSQYFGTEFGNECYCGDTFVNGPQGQEATDGRCSVTCAADGSQICGGSRGLTLYQSSSYVAPLVPKSISGYSSMGCYSDSAAKRVLTSQYTNNSMTLELCAANAVSNSATFYGVEYANECWTGATLGNTSQPLAQSSCNMMCPGNNAESCGGSGALQLYSLAPASSTSTTASSSTSSSSLGSTASSTSASSTSASPTSTSTSNTPTSTSSSSSVSTSDASSSTSASSTSTSSTSTSSTTSSSASATPSQVPLLCPGSNNTLWQAMSGYQYLIECDIDRPNGDLSNFKASSYENCIQGCDNSTSCVDISLSGNTCYMKKTLKPAAARKNIRGARVLYGNTTVTLTSSSSTYVTTISKGPSTMSQGSTLTASFVSTSSSKTSTTSAA